jgi:glutathione S-transferase
MAKSPKAEDAKPRASKTKAPRATPAAARTTAKPKRAAKPATPARRVATTTKAKPAATRTAAAKAKSAAKPAAAARKAPAARAITGARARTNAPSKEIGVYFWPTPNGQKVTIMLEECGLPYRIVPINIGKGDQFKKSFLDIAPNNRMPAIVDPAGPGNKPIALFESGAILRYLGEKTGKFYPKQLRARYEVDVWLFWQMAGLGPMAGQAHHFRQYAAETIPYAVDRYTDEVNRLYGVLDKRLKGRDFICDRYSIADMASWPWVRLYEMQGQDISPFKNLKKWLERVGNRKATMRGLQAGSELRQQAADLRSDEKARSVLFGQRAR